MKALKNDLINMSIQCRDPPHNTAASVSDSKKKKRASVDISINVEMKLVSSDMDRDTVSFGAGHYLSCLSNLRLRSEVSSEGVSRTGLTNPSNSVVTLSSRCGATKSFSHSRALESSEAEVGPLFTCLPPGRSAARRMSSSVRDLSQTGKARLIPTNPRTCVGILSED